MAEAREAEADVRRGRWRGPLHGIPIGLKDNIDTAGVRTTLASAAFKDRMPSADAEVVRRLKAAGAVLLGKQNLHEVAFGTTAAVSHFGPVRNPWNHGRIAGGSSGGSAAAVAAGLCFGAVGTDAGGSIRVPSAYCGIVGLKPTYGLVGMRGGGEGGWWSMNHLGPMCRTAADAALMLSAIAGYDPRDSTSVEAPVPNYTATLRAKVSVLRLGVPRAAFYDKLDPEIEAAVNAALGLLRRLTAGFREVSLQPISDTLAPNMGIELELIRNTAPFNTYGLPTISIPCGFTTSGLPIGIQISGPRFGEAKVLALAHAYEQATDWHTRRSPLV